MDDEDKEDVTWQEREAQMRRPRYVSGPATCRVCRHRWILCGHPSNEVTPSNLECPRCGHQSGEVEEGEVDLV